MRFLILSDIHANWEALEAVLNSAAGRYDKIVCCGDLIGYGPDPNRVQPEYALTARFSSVTDESSKHRSSYYLCVYTLTDLNSGQLLWTNQYEVKKSAVKGFLD